MKLVDLSGRWRVRAASKKKWIAALVPGCIRADLMAEEAISEFPADGGAAGSDWIGRESWLYERDFITPTFSPSARVILRCEGLDTLATIEINGRPAGRAFNMHRLWLFDIRDLLNAEENTISIRFDPPPENEGRAGTAWTRRMGGGSEPALPTCGIWRNIGIEIHEEAYIRDVEIRQIHDADGGVTLDVGVAVATIAAAQPLNAAVRLTYKGTLIAEGRVPLPDDGQARFNLNVRNAQRWWLNGMGDQPLYELAAEVAGATRKAIDTSTRRIGLRTVRLEQGADSQGEDFHFVVNGVPFFAKGANWTPPDPMLSRPTRVEYARLVKAASIANMNMLRVWGGGIYEQDWFYDLCDEYGICVWQDFMFAPRNAYPPLGDEWLANVRDEAAHNIMRLRDHACLALWCGNGGILPADGGGRSESGRMAQDDYSRLFNDLLPSLVASLDPEHDYWHGCPLLPEGGGEPGATAAVRGDAHLWADWQHKAPLRVRNGSTHRFYSMFGYHNTHDTPSISRASAPEPTSEAATTADGRCDVKPLPASVAPDGNDYFPPPRNEECAALLEQIRQGYAMKLAVEHWRRQQPHCMGSLYWRLNDGLTGGGSLDRDGCWKAPHYFARKFFAPILVSSIADPATGIVEVYVHNDLRQTFNGTIQWNIGDTRGHSLRQAGCPLVIAPGTVRRLGVLKMGDLLEKLAPGNLVVWLHIVAEDGYILSSNCTVFQPQNVMRIADPAISVGIRPWDDHCYAVTLTPARPAFWCWLELRGCQAKFDDNFVHLPANLPARIRVTPVHNMRIDEFRAALVVRSAWDIFNPMAPDGDRGSGSV